MVQNVPSVVRTVVPMFTRRRVKSENLQYNLVALRYSAYVVLVADRTAGDVEGKPPIPILLLKYLGIAFNQRLKLVATDLACT